MPNIQTIDPKKVNDAGRTVIDETTKMKKALDSITGIINGTKSYFDSEGGNAARKNFSESAAKFAEFEKFIKGYGEFLQNYGAATIKVDQAIEDLSNEIPKL